MFSNRCPPLSLRIRWISKIKILLLRTKTQFRIRTRTRIKPTNLCLDWTMVQMMMTMKIRTRINRVWVMCLTQLRW